MPRGRHRHSPPLHKLLPPSAVAGASVLCAGGAWLVGDALALRLLVAAAAAAAVTGAVLMRSWDHAAGRQVAELNRARTADQWKHDEKAAELESDLEEARELRVRLDAKLRAKRVELAALRTEHADLLRRYATAETERASALEGRRVLALESAAPTGAKALPPAGSTPTPEAYRRAAEALRNLATRATDTGAETAEDEEVEAAEAAETEAPEAADETPDETHDDAAHTRAPAMRHVPAAAAIVPYAARRPVPRPSGGFDYFGTKAAAIEAIEAVADTDLADVVGEEVLASAAQAPVERRAVGQVIDLTAHDETEQLDVAELRGAVSS
ncbi:hypothetical protein [Streptomyces sp. NPDC090025]|uniref:hypothetical protein n=1 Tax=Streptomyces sp. NPDC090025 TaxID=3365922 RepID=UPI0038335119